MARGWESKSVEEQIDMAEARHEKLRAKVLSDDALDVVKKRDSLLMSRTRVLRDLESAQNQRYRAVLEKALADLDAQLLTFAGK
ncbi:MAG: hypothetical protein ABI759_20510 [Candidatus Solibacter sp.]